MSKPPLQIGSIRPLVSIGSGARRAHVPVAKAKDEAQKQSEVWVPADDMKDHWSDEPSVGDQYTNEKYAGTFQEGPITTTLFTLSKADDCEELNKLMAQTDPPEAPRILLVGRTEVYNESKDHFKVLFSYRRIRYAKLIKRPEAPKEEAPAAPSAPEPPTEDDHE